MEAWGTAGGCHQLQSGGVLPELFDSGVNDNEIRGGYDITHYVLKSNGFSSHSIDSLGIEDFL